MMKLRTRAQFLRRVRAGARAKLVRRMRHAKLSDMRSTRDAMRHGWLRHAKLLRFVEFRERTLLTAIRAKSKSVMDAYPDLAAARFVKSVIAGGAA